MDGGVSGTTEAFARVKIDALLKKDGWNLTDGWIVLFEHALPDGTQADCVLCDWQGRPMAAPEAKRASTDPITAQDQKRHDAEQLGVPFVFLSNGKKCGLWIRRQTPTRARSRASMPRTTWSGGSPRAESGATGRPSPSTERSPTAFWRQLAVASERRF